MAVLNRKLFNRGGYVHRGTGIASGLTQPVQRFDDGGLAEKYKKSLKTLRGLDLVPERKPFSKLAAASPALLELGGKLLSGKSYQGGWGGGLDILGQAASASAPGFAQAIQARREYEATDPEASLKNMALEMALKEDKPVKPIWEIENLPDNKARKMVSYDNGKSWEAWGADYDIYKPDKKEEAGYKFQSLEPGDDGNMYAIFSNPQAKNEKDMIKKVNTGLGVGETDLSDAKTFQGTNGLQHELYYENGELKAREIPGQSPASDAKGVGGGDAAFRENMEKYPAGRKVQLTGTINPETNELYTNDEIDKQIASEMFDMVQKRLATFTQEQPHVLTPDEEYERALKTGDANRINVAADEWSKMATEKGESAANKKVNLGTMQVAGESAIKGRYADSRLFLDAIINQFDLDRFPALQPSIKLLKEEFIQGEVASTDVVKALQNLGILATAETGALPGNLNKAEFETLKGAFVSLYMSPEGYELTTELFSRDAQIDEMRLEAWNNYIFDGKLSGELFGDEVIEAGSQSEAINKIRSKIKELKGSMISGSEEFGWEDLTEKLRQVKNYGDMASDFKGLKIQADVGFEEQITVDLDKANAQGNVEFIGYSNENSKIEYPPGSGEMRNAIAPGLAMYAVLSDELNPQTQKPFTLIYGYNNKK